MRSMSINISEKEASSIYKLLAETDPSKKDDNLLNLERYLNQRYGRHAVREKIVQVSPEVLVH